MIRKTKGTGLKRLTPGPAKISSTQLWKSSLRTSLLNRDNKWLICWRNMMIYSRRIFWYGSNKFNWTLDWHRIPSSDPTSSLKTPEKKLYKLSALQSSVEANAILQEWSIYFKSLIGSLPTPTLSVGVGRIFESVCLSVCLFVRNITRKRMIPKCSN